MKIDYDDLEDNDLFIGELEKLARMMNAPQEILKQLADAVKSLKAIAGNPSTPIEILKKLSDNEDANVHCAVAGNPNTPLEILKKLSKDQDLLVRNTVKWKNANENRL